MGAATIVIPADPERRRVSASCQRHLVERVTDAGKFELGSDDFCARKYLAWDRHVTLRIIQWCGSREGPGNLSALRVARPINNDTALILIALVLQHKTSALGLWVSDSPEQVVHQESVNAAGSAAKSCHS